MAVTLPSLTATRTEAVTGTTFSVPVYSPSLSVAGLTSSIVSAWISSVSSSGRPVSAIRTAGSSGRDTPYSGRARLLIADPSAVHTHGLPLDVALETVAVLRQVARTHAVLGKLSGYCGTLPNAALLADSVIVQEARSSSRIENTSSRRRTRTTVRWHRADRRTPWPRRSSTTGRRSGEHRRRGSSGQNDGAASSTFRPCT